MPGSQPDVESLTSENERLKQAVGELSVLNEVVTAIGTCRDVECINKLILQICIRHFHVEQGVIHLLDPAHPDDMLRTGVRVRREGSTTDTGDGRFRLGPTLTGWVLKHQEPLVTDDLATDARFRGTVAEVPHVRSVLAVPIKTHQQTLGILSLFNKREGAPWTDGDRRLLGMIAVQSAQVIENARLHVIEEDMRAARSIQQGLLPANAPALSGLDLFGYASPASDVGGDYFDWIELPDGRLGCVVADVSGKGMPAALVMAQLQACFRTHVQRDHRPDRVLTEVNTLFGCSLDPDRFVTLFYAVVDPVANELQCSNAGHNPPLLWRADGRLEWLAEGGMLLGRISQAPYRAFGVPFRPGDGLVVYTDGLTEAESDEGEEWGRERLGQAVLAGRLDSAREVGERIRRAVETHVGRQRQNDDVTLTVIRRF
jgi:sigma-B regulation protein RsbU (phosphoserine phosphatase)